MAAFGSVTVLCPNGRRQNVRVTPNTSILQVLEDACKKQGLNPEDYDIKHFSRKLDLSLSIRFSNVPNNAMLELCPASSKRQEQPVTIGLQLESGQRILNDFQPSSTLWDVVRNGIQSNNAAAWNDNQEPVCIYMRREILGREGLESTTLRSLGLTSGKAIIRLLYREKGAVCDQAHVSSPIVKSSNDFIIDTWDSESVTSSEAKASSSGSIETTKTIEPEQIGGSWEGSTAPMPLADPSICNDNTPVSSNTDEQAFNEGYSDSDKKLQHYWGKGVPLNSDTDTASQEHQIESSLQYAPEKNEDTTEAEEESVHYWGSGRRLNEIGGEASGTSVAMEVDDVNESFDRNGMPSEVDEDDSDTEVQYLGERDALLFHLDDVPQVKLQDMPDEFYELTMDDALFLLAELKRQRRELEERPLETTLQRLTKQVSRERQYRRTIIRVQFPSRHVLQACFSPSETGASLKTFVRGFLQNPSQDFYLFTTPPKTLLNDDNTLFEMNLVPAAVVYFGTKEVVSNDILREGLEKKVTKAKAVFKAASSARKAIQKEFFTGCPPEKEKLSPKPAVTASQALANKPSNSTQNVQPQGKVPKWFKFGK